jgi:endonuclease YncB( thermonuclease family)
MGEIILVNSQNISNEEAGASSYITNSHDIDLGELLISEGMAWEFLSNGQEKTSRYKLAEEKAKNLKKGVWKDASPTPPWVFREELRPPTRTIR